ncbi:DNA-3-methyladenine glycosylase family protein [Millisia brevis]|uniref:DNA-3-methyladenine glycosylase family protein n=1 Tax=Millisia brevis TaxID=264148 RepID=UPI0008379FCE|nr:DNA-3-methyladenine glycosylase [Millisia brevis]
MRTLDVRGTFSLRASTRFLEGFAPARYDGSGPTDERPTLRLGFVVDGTDEVAGAVITQQDDGTVTAVIDAADTGTDSPIADAAARQIERILSIDVDGTGFPAIGERDPVIGALLDRFDGLRPVCFLSPYESACWAVIGHRVRIAQAAALKERIARTFGTVVTVDGAQAPVFPSPARLAQVADQLPLPEVKQQRLHALATAALGGALDADRLRALDTESALKALQELPGIGPFSAELILIRGCGAPDIFPTAERRLIDSMRQLYREPDAELPRLRAIAEAWQPYRSWAAVLVRAYREETTGEIGGRMS